jgi:hypothetical protein
LQFYDPAADVGLLAGIGPIGKETTAARLLLFLGGQRVALFTGERTPPRNLSVEPLHLGVDDDGMTLRFAGPILHLDDGATYLDLEAAFVESTLADLDVNIRFVRRGADASGAEFGGVEGSIVLAGNRRTISASGFVNAGISRAGQRQAYAMLAADFGDSHGVLANAADGLGTKVVEFRSGAVRDVSPGESSALNSDAGAAARPIELTMDDAGVLRATPKSRMEILRSIGTNHYARVTFGTAHFEWGKRRGHGLYEFARLVA